MKNRCTIFLILLIALCIVSCDKEEPVAGNGQQWSYRDGVYGRSQATVTLDGVTLTSVASVQVSSQAITTNYAATETGISFDPIYNSQITITGFPNAGGASKIEFITVSDISGFFGTTRIGGLNYAYEGRFTGDPLSAEDKKGIVIDFQLIK